MNTTPYPDPIPCGANYSVPFQLFQRDGVTPYDYTGHTLRCFVSDTPYNSGSYVVTKGTDDGGITPVTPSSGTGNINFLAADSMVGRSYTMSIWDETAKIPLYASIVTFDDVPGR